MKPTLDDMLNIWPDDPNIKRCQKLLDDHREKIEFAGGSRKAHHNWEGGYADHVVQTMSLFLELYDISFLSGALDTLPEEEKFEQVEGIVVMFLHDIEKPFQYEGKIPLTYSKDQKAILRDNLYWLYEFEFTFNQVNALKYVEGARDADYVPGERPERPLAALCHAADFLSLG